MTVKKNEPAEQNADAPAEPSEQAKGEDSQDSQDSVDTPAQSKQHTTIVGVGASAGGLEALQEFFDKVPSDSGLAYVVVTHQHAGHVSMMAELLSRHSDIPVNDIRSGTLAQPNMVYVAPPGSHVAILHGVLELMEPEGNAPVRLPIDYFFRSLARDQGSHAVGIVLSGTGSDGSLGLKAIKGEGGMSMAQAEDSARYPGMPRSAIATGQVDFVLPVAELPGQLIEYVKGADSRAAVVVGEQGVGGDLRRVMVLLRTRTNHDFSNYKETTIRRRIQRRMNLHGLVNLEDYTRYLQTNPAEVDSLFQELLINVTSFFRDPDAFDVLSSTVFPELLADKPDDYVFRIWVPGCSTGEEAYSLAIILREACESLNRRCNAQIFATDLDSDAVESARTGRYPAGISHDVNPQRLARFFTPADHFFQINKDLREMVIFAPQNLLQDPPFTKLDLLSCRNVLIYLDSVLQSRLLPMFHYALRPGGVLFLGSSESIGSDSALFRPIDKRWKIFKCNDVPSKSYAAGFPTTVTPHGYRGHTPLTGLAPATTDTRATASLQADRILLKELVPPTVVCDERGEIVHIHGRTGEFLELAPGPQSSNNLFKMAREGLQLDLAAAVRQASREDGKSVHRAIRFKNNGDVLLTDLSVRRLREPEQFRNLLLVSFHNVRDASAEPGEENNDEPLDRVAELMRELQHTKDVHQGTVEQLQTSNEELKSTNEELQSTNEELQSTNEELETSKEEMQSLNEELHTVNAELQAKLAELAQVNDDMKNLLNGTDIATIFVDNGLCIKRYTEQVKRIANLIPSDIGRPLGDLVSKLVYPRLIDDAKEVLRTLSFREVEVQGPDDTWFQVRIMPYRTTENVIDGLVMTFVDITKIKRLRDTERKMAEIMSSSMIWVFGNDTELRYTWSGDPGPLGHRPDQIIGKRDEDFLPPHVAELLAGPKREALKTGKPVRRLVTLTTDDVTGAYDFRVQPKRSSSGEIKEIACVLSRQLEPHSEERQDP